MPRARPSGRARRRALLAVVLACACATPSAQAAVTGTHVVTALPRTSSLDIRNFAGPLAVELVRNGIVIGRASGTPDASGRLLVNQTGACWSVFTPEIRPGDTVRVGGDSMVVQALTAGAPGAPDPVSGDVVVTGTATDPGGSALPAGGLSSVLFGSFADMTATPIVAPDGTWTATFAAAAPPTAVPPATVGGARILFNGADGGTTAVNSGGGAAGPGNGCSAPFNATAATAIDAGHLVGGVPTINVANSSQPLTVSGPVAADATALTATLGGATAPGALSGGTWSATFAPADLAAQPDGNVAATPAGGAALTILKDTVAPVPPASSPPPGRYSTTPTVTLVGEPGSRIHFTVDGSQPTGTSPVFTAPIRVSTSETIKAFAVDAVGNSGPVASLIYQLGAGSGPAGPGAPPPGSDQSGVPPTTGPGAGEPLAARISVLKVSKRVSLRRLAKQGLGVGVQLAKGTKAVRFTVYRRVRSRGRNRLKLVASVVRVPGAGRYRTRLNARALGLTKVGVYRLKVVPGLTRTTFDQGAARTIFLRVVR